MYTDPALRTAMIELHARGARKQFSRSGPATQITPGTIAIMALSLIMMIFILFVAPFIGWGV